MGSGLFASRQRLGQRSFARERVTDAITRLTMAVVARPIAPALKLVRDGGLTLFVDAIAVLEPHVAFVERLVRGGASAEQRERQTESSKMRARQERIKTAKQSLRSSTNPRLASRPIGPRRRTFSHLVTERTPT